LSDARRRGDLRECRSNGDRERGDGAAKHERLHESLLVKIED
jgi:hypothetical protein